MTMQVWGLYSSRVDPFHSWELLAVFTSQELAETVMANLIGKPVDPRRSRAFDAWPVLWEVDEDDPEFSDLHVRPLEMYG